MKAKKAIWSVILVIIVIIVLAVGGFVLFLDSIVAGSVRKFGSDATGVPVELNNVSISLFGGSVGLNKLTIANPEGYHEKHAFGFDKFFVDIDLGTVTSDKIVINLIEIDGIHVAFEPTLSGGSNLIDIKNNIDDYLRKDKAVPSKTPPTEPMPGEVEKPDKKVVIRKLRITNGKVTVASKLLAQRMTLPLATIEMSDIGEDGASQSGEVLLEIYARLMEAVARAVSGSELKGIKLDGLTSSRVQDTVRGLQDSVKDAAGGDVKDAVRGLRESIGF